MKTKSKISAIIQNETKRSEETMTTQFVESLINSKINVNQNEIIFTFYELRVKHNLTEEQTDEFLALCKIRLENLDYKVYFTGAKYTYRGERKEVENNQLMIAVKE